MSAAAIPVLICLAVLAVEIARVVATLRRAVRLNRALHELRRPLQSISLSIAGERPDLACAGACLEQARGALEELDAVVNRRVLRRERVRTAIGQITEALEDRWRVADVHVSAPTTGRELDADPIRLGAALDNLVANAIEHGGGDVSVRALASAGGVRFEVRDGGGSQESPCGHDPHRGHGLTVAAETAAEHGGTLVPPLRLASGGGVTALSLPAAPEDMTA